jgi:hypothetical protein
MGVVEQAIERAVTAAVPLSSMPSHRPAGST